MRMTSLVFGVIILLLGLSIIIKVVFKIDFPVFKILLGLFFLYLGLRMIFGGSFLFRHSDSGSSIFGSRNNSVHREYNSSGKNDWDSDDNDDDTNTGKTFSGKKNYDIIFGSSVIDLREIELKDKVTTININTIFGSTKVLVNPKTPYKITTDVVFGSVRLPDGNAAGFGTSNHLNQDITDSTKYLNLKVSVVFGSSDIRQ